MEGTSLKELRYYYDTIGDTLTLWYDDPALEAFCEEADDEIVLMKDASGRTIGKEILWVSSRRADVLRGVFEPASA